MSNQPEHHRGVLCAFLGITLINFIMGVIFLLIWQNNLIVIFPSLDNLVTRCADQSMYQVGFTNSINTISLGFGSISFGQLIYVVPLIWWTKNAARYGWMKGIIMGASLTASITGNCFIMAITCHQYPGK